MDGWRERFLQFLFPVESDRWLAVLRVGLGLQVVLYALSLRNDWNYLFAATGQGLITRNLAEALLSLESRFIPRLGWIITLGAHVGLREETILSAAWFCLFCAGCGLLLGLASRFSAILAWFLHLCATKSGDFVSYGVDSFMTIGLFYLMLSPLPDRYSLDQRFRKPQPKDPQLLGFFRRVLQLHLCFIYFFGGLTKCLGDGWWNGSNIWRALTRPPFNVIPPDILVSWKYFLPVLGILICLIEIGYPVFVWVQGTRTIWLVCVLGMHLMIGLAMGMYLFALIMIVLNLAAFGPVMARGRVQQFETHGKELAPAPART
jgi:Vitamin K-dependent gamma-carboxylase